MITELSKEELKNNHLELDFNGWYAKEFEDNSAKLMLDKKSSIYATWMNREKLIDTLRKENRDYEKRLLEMKNQDEEIVKLKNMLFDLFFASRPGYATDGTAEQQYRIVKEFIVESLDTERTLESQCEDYTALIKHLQNNVADKVNKIESLECTNEKLADQVNREMLRGNIYERKYTELKSNCEYTPLDELYKKVREEKEKRELELTETIGLKSAIINNLFDCIKTYQYAIGIYKEVIDQMGKEEITHKEPSDILNK